MKKVQVYKGFVIAVNKAGDQYQVFTQEEWSMGEGYRYAEYDDCGSVQECKDNIDSH